MTDRELMQMALDALEDACGGRCNTEYNPCYQREAIEAIRARLAQPEPEPIGFFSVNDYGNWEQNESGYGEPFYAAPLQRELGCCLCGSEGEISCNRIEN